MSVDYTTSGMVETIKKRAAIPNGQPAYSDDNLIKILSDELLYTVVPFIMTLQEEFFVHYVDTAIENNKFNYPIPTRSIASGLRDLKVVSSNGDEQDIPRISPENDQNFAYGITIRDNNVRLLNPSDWTGYSLRMYYYLRPSYLVPTDEAAIITGINGNDITIDTVPGTWSIGEVTDFINGKPPFNIKLTDQTVSNITSNILTMASEPTGVIVGDRIAKADESPIANIPYAAQPYLIQSAILTVLEGLGDQAGFKLAAAAYMKMENNLKTLISPRITGEPKVINGQDLFL